MDSDRIAPALEEALARVLQDVRATIPERVSVQPGNWGSIDDQLTAWLAPPVGGRVGVWIRASDGTAEQLVRLADQVQDAVVPTLWSLGRSATWPTCPWHPTGLPVKPGLVNGEPWWSCPDRDRPVAPIGSLGEALTEI